MTEIQSPPAETDEETPRSGAEILLQIVNSLGDLCQIGAHALQKREAEVAWLEERVHAARSEREELAIFTQGLQKLTDYLNDHLPLLEEGTLSGESPDLTEIQQAYEEARAQAEELTQELEMTVFERDSLFEELQERSKSLSSLERQARAWAAEAVDGAVFDDEALDDDEEDLDAALDRDFAGIQQHNPAQMPDAVREDGNLMADLLDDEEETSEAAAREADSVADAHDEAATEINQESAGPDSEPDENDSNDPEAGEITNEISFREDNAHSDGIEAQHEAADTETDSASEKESTAIASNAETAAEGDEETPQAQSAQDEQSEEAVDISPEKSDAVAEEASGNQDDEDGNTGEEEVSDPEASLEGEDSEPGDTPAQPETEPEKAETDTDTDADTEAETAAEAGDDPLPEISAVDETDDAEMEQSNDEATGLTSNEAEGGDAEADAGQVIGAEAESSLAAAEEANETSEEDAESNEASEEDAEADGDTGGNEVSGERALDAPEPLAASPVDDLLPASIELDDEDLAVVSSDTADEGQSAESLPAAAQDETAEESALVVSAQDEDDGEGAERLDIPAPIAPAPLLLDDLDGPAATEE